MKEKEKRLDYKLKMIIGLLIFSIIGVGVAYLIADQLAIEIPDENSKVYEQNEVTYTCDYSELKNPTDLTADDKVEIINLFSKSNSHIEIEFESLKVTSIDNYIYSVEFEFVRKEGSYSLKDILWKKNGVWENYGSGSDFLPEEYENIHLNICTACSNEC